MKKLILLSILTAIILPFSALAIRKVQIHKSNSGLLGYKTIKERHFSAGGIDL